ncbi:MAG TPA: DNA-binding domain-containing protein [Kofleriaceae bacterium]|nr:DNA-binding domain-containing protein [Kofleriaceae bacterium]
MADLAALQRQFYDRVVSGAPADGMIASGDVEVYAGMYTTRLIDAIAEDYPKLRAALGEDRFGDVVAHYVRAHPPWSFTLREAGAALAAFLSGSELAPPWAADLAALERARIEVFDGPDAEPLTQEAVAALGEALPELALAWVPASVVVPLAWTVDDLWSAIEDEQPFEEPRAEARVVLAWRRDLAVLHRTLDADEARLAPRIAEGATFAALCEVLGELHGDAATSRAVELLLRWLGAAALRTSTG